MIALCAAIGAKTKKAFWIALYALTAMAAAIKGFLDRDN